MEEPIVGLRVKIEIEDDGSSNPPTLPPGTIIRIIIGPDRETYYLVHLDNPVRSKHVRTGRDWILNNLAVAPNFKGGSLRPIIASVDSYVTVGIVNMFTLPGPDDPLLDFSKGEYFATGKVRKAME